MGDSNEILSVPSGANSNKFHDDFDFYLSDINHESINRGRAAKIRVLNDKSTCMSPAGDFTAVESEQSSNDEESQSCDQNVIEDLLLYKNSIDELRKESRILLQRSPRQGELQKELSDVLQRPRENLTILKLLWKDRERIGSMINDLAEAKQTILSLNSQILRQRDRGKQMRNWANKKIDALEERVEMLKAKEKYTAADHVESVRLLNEKLSEAQTEAEASAQQSEMLKLELTELAKVAQENQELREKLSLLKKTSKEYRKQEKHFLSTIQRKAKTTQTEWAEQLSPEENFEKTQQSKRKLNGNLQEAEKFVGDLKFNRLSVQDDGDTNKIRKKTGGSRNYTAHRQRDSDSIQISDFHEMNSNRDSSILLSTPEIMGQDSDEDDLIRELFFKF